MIPALYELVGLPAATSQTEIAYAADRHSEELFNRASYGDRNAQRDLVILQFAYLLWAYGNRPVELLSTMAGL